MYPLLYYFVSLSSLLFLLMQCQPTTDRYPTNHWMRSDIFFVSISLLLFVFMRVPSIFYNQELNPDESQLLTQAITLGQDPVYGRSVDGTSIGPINSYLLLLPHYLGLPLDFTEARLTASLLIAASLVFFFLSLRRLVSYLPCRLSFLFVLLFFSWSTHTEFLHFSSELSSLLILTACFYLTLRLLKAGTHSQLLYVGLGLLAGLVLYAKLQALPIVGMMLLTLTLYLWYAYRWRASRYLGLLGAGFVLPTFIVFALAYAFNVQSYFIDYYFVGNLTTYGQIYAQVPLVQQGFVAKLLHFPQFIIRYSDFLVFSGLTCGLVLLMAGWRNRNRLKRVFTLRWPVLLTLATVVGALFAVITPGTEFGHHLLLLVYPLGWLTSLGLQAITQINWNARLTTGLVRMAAVVVLFELAITDNVLLPYVFNQPAASTRAWLLSRNPQLFSFPSRVPLASSPVSRLIDQYTQPGDKIAIWGWLCRYYVEADRAQGVSENHTQRSIIPNVMQDQYLDRYARDLERNKPILFLDGVGKTSYLLKDTSQTHEHFPRINHVVKQHYTYITSLDSVRVYLRSDRLGSAANKSNVTLIN